VPAIAASVNSSGSKHFELALLDAAVLFIIIIIKLPN
jgi:hypothetical protein